MMARPHRHRRSERERHRTVMKGRHHGSPLIDYVSCTAHGKNAYHSRKDARAVVKAMQLRYPDTTASLEAYPCAALEGMWHVGNSSWRDEHNGRTHNRS